MLPRRFTGRDGSVCTVRLAAPMDALAMIAVLDMVGAEGSYILYEPGEATPQSLARGIETVEKSGGLYLAAERQQKLVGHLRLVRPESAKLRHTASLAMALAPVARELGLGRALMEEALEWAGRQGVVRINLSVFASNTRAIKLYEQNGFVVEGVRRGQFLLQGRLEDEVMMGHVSQPPAL